MPHSTVASTNWEPTQQELVSHDSKGHCIDATLHTHTHLLCGANVQMELQQHRTHGSNSAKAKELMMWIKHMMKKTMKQQSARLISQSICCLNKLLTQQHTECCANDISKHHLPSCRATLLKEQAKMIKQQRFQSMCHACTQLTELALQKITAAQQHACRSYPGLQLY